jgi:hypothetical protein
MGSILDILKKGISALNPVGTPMNKKPVTPITATPPIPVIDATKNTGYLGNAAKKSVGYNKAVQDVAEETK